MPARRPCPMLRPSTYIMSGPGARFSSNAAARNDKNAAFSGMLSLMPALKQGQPKKSPLLVPRRFLLFAFLLLLRLSLAETGVVDRPHHIPSRAAIRRAFPAPVELVFAEILVNHALLDRIPIFVFRVAHEDGAVIVHISDEVQIRAAVVHPSLLPLSRGGIEGRNTHPVQPDGLVGLE